MFDIGWSEMAIIMLLALIIIGPKDLPRVARTVGQWVRKARMLAREFQTSLEDMARETELDEVKKEIEKVGRTDFKKSVENTIDPKGELTKAFDTSDDEKLDGDTPAIEKKAAAETKAVTGSASNDAAAKRLNGGGGSAGEKAAGKVTPGKATEAEVSGAGHAGVTPPVTKPATEPKPAASAKKPAAATKTTAARKTTAAKKPATNAKASPSTSGKAGTARKAAAPKARAAKKPAASGKPAAGDTVAAKSS